MALKDWKKVGKNEWTDKNSVAVIWIHHLIHETQGSMWQLQIQDRFAQHHFTNFKKKSQALADARSYMRKH